MGAHPSRDARPPSSSNVLLGSWPRTVVAFLRLKAGNLGQGPLLGPLNTEVLMAKKKTKIPKEVMGVKIPKSIRKSSVISGLLANKAGRQMVAAALTAAATAAAGVLVAERKEVAHAAEKGAKKTVKGASIVGEAMEQAFKAAMAELNLLPKGKGRKDDSRRSYEGAPVH